MTTMADLDNDSVPAWMTPTRPTKAEKIQVALSWSGKNDPRFKVSLPRLEELIEGGHQATSRYYFKLVWPSIGETEFNAWCRKLGKDLHNLVSTKVTAELASELEPYAMAIGDVTNWTYGFTTIFDYLNEVRARTNIDVDSLAIIGRPGRPLLEVARNGSTGNDDAGELVGGSAQSPAQRVREILQQEKNVIVEGVAGSGKSHLLDALRKSYSHVEVVVFHPSTSYEEFVSGLRPTLNGGFEGVSGTFILACERAAASPDAEHLLFIDEINRANTSKVFGDLLLPLEKGKRQDVRLLGGHALVNSTPDGAVGVTLQTPVGNGGLNVLVVPDNLHVLGTMNSTDRSVGTIDLALRRRFSWFSMEPMPAITLMSNPDFINKIAVDSSETQQDWQTVVDWYGQTNETLMDAIGPDARLGHAYMFSATSPQSAARSLVSQLAEIAFTFNLSADTLDDVPALELPNAAISLNASYRGQGLGRRPSVDVQYLVSTSENDGDNE